MTSHVVRGGHSIAVRATGRARAPRWELMTRVQGTGWRPKGVGTGNEVGKARRNKMSRKIGFESKDHGSLVVWGRGDGGASPGQGCDGGEKWWDSGISGRWSCFEGFAV